MKSHNWNVSSEMECFILCLGCVIYGLIVNVSDIKGTSLWSIGLTTMVMGYELSAHFIDFTWECNKYLQFIRLTERHTHKSYTSFNKIYISIEIIIICDFIVCQCNKKQASESYIMSILILYYMHCILLGI